VPNQPPAQAVWNGTFFGFIASLKVRTARGGDHSNVVQK
jgi:hypothetical protein